MGTLSKEGLEPETAQVGKSYKGQHSMKNSDIQNAPPLKRVTVLAYSLGTVAKGIKVRGLSSFLMLFYNQVVGVPAALAGTAIMIALILDGICSGSATVRHFGGFA